MKYATSRPFADPEAAARKLLEIAHETESVQDGRINIEKINGPFLFRDGGSPAEEEACTHRHQDREHQVAVRLLHATERHHA